MSTIPGPKSWPIVGNALQLDRTPQGYYEQLLKWAKEYRSPGCFCIWFGSTPFIVISKAEYVEEILSNQKNINKNDDYTLFHAWLGTGLLTSSEKKWRSRRRLLTPAFHYQILNDYMPIHQKQSSILIPLLKEKAGQGEFDIAPYLYHYTLDSTCEAAMGVDVNAQFDSNTKYVSAVKSITRIIIERWRCPWLWRDAIYNLTTAGKKHKDMCKTLHDFTDKVINDRIKQRELDRSRNSRACAGVMPIHSQRKRKAFLDILLDEYDKGNIPREGVREEVDTFMFEGDDTMASSLQWAVHMIGKHPDVQSKLQIEVDKFYESVGDGVITADRLKELKYLECVIKETLRCIPSVN